MSTAVITTKGQVTMIGLDTKILIRYLAQENGCKHILIFDKKAISPGMTLAE